MLVTYWSTQLSKCCVLAWNRQRSGGASAGLLISFEKVTFAESDLLRNHIFKAHESRAASMTYHKLKKHKALASFPRFLGNRAVMGPASYLRLTGR